MTPDEKHEIFTKGFESGKSHSKSAPETIERFNKLEIDIVKMSGNIDTILSKVGELVERVKEANHKTASHSKWINENNKDVLSISSIQTKILLFSGILIGVNVVGFVAFWNMIKNLIS